MLAPQRPRRKKTIANFYGWSNCEYGPESQYNLYDYMRDEANYDEQDLLDFFVPQLVSGQLNINQKLKGHLIPPLIEALSDGRYRLAIAFLEHGAFPELIRTHYEFSWIHLLIWYNPDARIWHKPISPDEKPLTIFSEERSTKLMVLPSALRTLIEETTADAKRVNVLKKTLSEMKPEEYEPALACYQEMAAIFERHLEREMDIKSEAMPKDKHEVFIRYYLEKIGSALKECDRLYKIIDMHSEPHKLVLGKLQIYSDQLGLTEEAARYQERLMRLSTTSSTDDSCSGGGRGSGTGIALTLSRRTPHGAGREEHSPLLVSNYIN